MSRFYESAAVAMIEIFSSLREDGGGMFTADFVISEKDGRIAVTIIERRRIRGRRANEKKVTHVWRDGVIISDREKANPRHG